MARKHKVKKQLTVYADGSADIKSLTSGYGYVVLDSAGNIVEEGSGTLDYANNTYAELNAVLIGTEAALKYNPSQITVYTDYQTIPYALKHEISRWKKHDWQTSKGKKVRFEDLWKKLLKFTQTGRIKFDWVKGHCGNVHNDRCDFLAGEAVKVAIADKQIKAA